MKRIYFFIKKYRIPLLTTANASILFILTLCFMDCKYTPAGSVEVEFFRKAIGLKRAILSKDDFTDTFVFIDVSYSKKLISKDNGKQDITDRYLLAKLFRIIHRLNNPQKFILCDIIFEDSSSDDALLTKEIKKVDNLIIPYKIAEDEELSNFSLPINVHRGFVEYTAADTSGTFLRYHLIKRMNGHYYKSIPLRMYEEIHHVTFEPRILLSKIENKFSLNTLVVDFRVQNNIPYHRLSELVAHNKDGNLFYSVQDINEMIKDRIVVIGNFSDQDMHETIMGDKPGAIILINTYLSLVHGENFVSSYFLLFLFSCYTMISYNIFCYKNFTDRKTVGKTIAKLKDISVTTKNLALFLIKKINLSERIIEKVSKLRWRYFTYPIFLTTIFSLFLILFFHVYINILIFGSYLAILESVVRVRRDRKYLPDKASLVIAEFIKNSKKSPEEVCSIINIRYPDISISLEDISQLFKKYDIE